MLTARQRELLLFICEFQRRRGVPPSFDEMRAALGLRSKSGVHRLITALVDREFLRRLPHRARSIEVIRAPDELFRERPRLRLASERSDAGDGPISAASRPPSSHPANGLVEPRERLEPRLQSSQPREGARGARIEAASAPFMGRIAAGTPIEAIAEQEALIEIPSVLRAKGDHFVLRVIGDSMIEAGIADGDLVVIERCEDAASGSIVVALIDGAEATLKRLHKRGDRVALEAANPRYEPRLYRAGQVEVQGRLVGLMRRY